MVSIDSEITEDTRASYEMTPRINRAKMMDSSPVPEPTSPSPQ